MKTFFSCFVIIILVFPHYTKSQWVQQNLPGEINVTLGIDFINQNHGITGGWYGDISQQIYGKAYFTYDGGSNWIETIVPDSMRVMVEVQMINDNICYGAGAYNTSENISGQNQYKYLNTNIALRKHYERIGMNFSGQENYRGYFVETTDGGLTWHPKGVFEDSVFYLVEIAFLDLQTGFVIATSQGVTGHAILKTSDSGNSWYYVYPFQEPLWIQDIKFVNNLDGIAVGELTASSTGVVLTTSDGGENWNEQYIAGLSSIFSIAYPDSNTIIIGGINSSFQAVVYKSTDSGISWQEIKTYSGSEFIQGVDAVHNSAFQLIYGTVTTPNWIPFVDISSDGGNNWNYSQLQQFLDYLPVASKMVDEARWYLTGTNNLQSGFVLFTDNAGGVPVELISFYAESIENGIQLKWTTATELNNMGFEIE